MRFKSVHRTAAMGRGLAGRQVRLAKSFDESWDQEARSFPASIQVPMPTNRNKHSKRTSVPIFRDA